MGSSRWCTLRRWAAALFVFSASITPHHVDSWSNSAKNYYWSPSMITLERASQAYPDSLWRKLTSSEPRRKFALNDVSLIFDSSSVTLLLGESSSGKSTILRLVIGAESPVSGQVLISNQEVTMWAPRPVYLDTRPSYGRNDKMQDIWKKCLPVKEVTGMIGVESCLAQLLEILNIPLESKILDLSTSQVYLCRIGEACLESILANAAAVSQPPNDPSTSKIPEKEERLPAPILLLDEWLDTETSTVVQTVQSTLHELSSHGGVIICVTHKPQLFSSSRNGELRRVTLRQGKLVLVNTSSS